MSGDPATLRTTRARLNYLGSARSGTQHNAQMRLTSLALIPLSIAFVVMALSLISRDYNAARSYLSHPLPSLLMLLFIGAGVRHMHLGMRTIIEDYIHGRHAKEAALTLNLFFAVSIGLACVYAVLRIGFA